MAIIKYRVEANVFRGAFDENKCVEIGSTWQYEELYDPRRRGTLLSRDEANDRINELGLICVYQCKHGAVYDTPDEPFWRKFNGIYFNN